MTHDGAGRAPLAGRVVVVGVEQADAALAAAGAGAAVVVVGSDGDAVGALLDEVARAGGRASAFLGSLADDDGRAALTEMLAELFSGA